MLANPKWDDLIKWLETKNPDEPYNYNDSQRCMAAQFNNAHGRKYNLGAAFNSHLPRCFDRKMEMVARGCRSVSFPKGLKPLPHGAYLSHTFGAALHRARAMAE